MMRKGAFISMLAMSLLTACASPTPFKLADPDGKEGYAVQRLEEDRYLVAFAGNSATPRQTVEAYLLYLASQVTLKDGYDYFVLEGREVDKSVDYQIDSLGLGGRLGPHRRFLLADDIASYSRPVNRYDLGGEIVLRKGRKPSDDPRAYDARDLQEKVAPEVIRDPSKAGPY